MNSNRATLCLTVLAIVVAVLAATSVGVASPLERQLQGSGVPTRVSYQGQVKVGGVSYNGTGYFKFAIRSGSGGNEWTNDGTASGGGEPTASVALTVDNGLFNVQLGDTSLTNMTALPASVFDDPERYVRIWFSSDNGTFTLLSPDHHVAAVPYALQAEKTKGYANVVVVAKSGGDYTTISDALNSITTASVSNYYLIKVMPGVYNERVVMKEYVDIEGSGELNTKITYTGSSTLSQATLKGANNAELRTLTVENTGGDNFSIAIYNDSTSPRLTQVTASASGGTQSFGVSNTSSSSPVMTDVSATASGGSNNNTGVYNGLSSPEMTNVRASASGGTQSFGVYNYGSSPKMMDVSASASGGTNNRGVYNNGSSPVMTNVSASAEGGINNRGVNNSDSSSPVITALNASASGGTDSFGVFNDSSSATIRNSVISASGATNNYGIFNIALGGSYKVTVDNSQITATSNTIRNDAEFTTRIGASLLSVGIVTGTGTITCAGVYNQDYTFYASTCP